MEEPGILESLVDISRYLPKRQLQLARFIHASPHEAAFMNSVEMAKAAGVSNPTVIRLAYRLGFSGFPDFQKALQMATVRRVEQLEKFSGEEEGLCQRVLSLEFQVLRDMKEKLDANSVSRAVELLESRRTVFVVGLFANTCLADYLGYFLSILRENVQVLVDFDHEAYGRIRDAGPDSVAVVYSFPRYPSGTQSLARLFRKEGIPVIGVTDGGMSPLASLSDLLLEAPMKFITFIDPCAGAFAMTHALLSAFYMKNPEKMRRRLKGFEEFAAARDLFERKDIDIVGLA